MDKKNRAAGRNRVMLAAQLLTRSGEEPVRVRDLSGNGAKLVAPPIAEEGTDVILRHRDLFAAAKVQWVRDGEIGIEFYRAQPSELEAAS